MSLNDFPMLGRGPLNPNPNQGGPSSSRSTPLIANYNEDFPALPGQKLSGAMNERIVTLEICCFKVGQILSLALSLLALSASSKTPEPDRGFGMSSHYMMSQDNGLFGGMGSSCEYCCLAPILFLFFYFFIFIFFIFIFYFYFQVVDCHCCSPLSWAAPNCISVAHIMCVALHI